MRRLVAALTIAGGLTLAPAVAAKELTAVEVCGASGCNRAEDRETLRDVLAESEEQGQLEEQEQAGAASPFYRITFVSGEGPNTHVSSLYYIPSHDTIASVDPYQPIQTLPIFVASAKAVVRRLSAGLKPFPAARVTPFSVRGKELRTEAARAHHAPTERAVPLVLAAGVSLTALLTLLVVRKRRSTARTVG